MRFANCPYNTQTISHLQGLGLYCVDVHDIIQIRKRLPFWTPPFQPFNAFPKGNRQTDYPVPALPLTRQERAIIVSKCTVLVVKGDFAHWRQITCVLLKFGCNVSMVSERLETIRLPDARKTHFVPTDIQMLCLDRISLLKYIKTFFQQARVLVVTFFERDRRSQTCTHLISLIGEA